MRVLDLFCGAAGGWSLGLHRAGFKTVAACEIDPARRAAFAHNNPGVLMYDDVRQLTAARLLRDLGYLPDVIAGSPPCQDASTANHKGRGIDGERTGLFRDFVRIVGEVRPRWVAAENVPGIRTRGADWVLDALEAEGYACWPLVVGAVHAGAPHPRGRVWFIAANTDEIGRRRLDTPRRARAEPEGSTEDGPHANQDQRGISAPDARFAGHLAALERATGEGYKFAGGPAGHLGMADGVSPELARWCTQPTETQCCPSSPKPSDTPSGGQSRCCAGESDPAETHEQQEVE